MAFPTSMNRKGAAGESSERRRAFSRERGETLQKYTFFVEIPSEKCDTKGCRTFLYLSFKEV